MGAYVLRGRVQVDDAYLGGERCGGKAWSWHRETGAVWQAVFCRLRRATPGMNKTCHRAHVLFLPAIADWAKISLAIGC